MIIESELYKEIEEYNRCVIENYTNEIFTIHHWYKHPLKDPSWLTAYYLIDGFNYQYDIPLDLYHMSVRDKKLKQILD